VPALLVSLLYLLPPTTGLFSNQVGQMNWQSLTRHHSLLRLLAPRRSRLAFCRAHKAGRIASRFEQLFDAARSLEKFEILAHECPVAPNSESKFLSSKSGFSIQSESDRGR